MKVTRSDVLQQPLWVSALLASARRGAADLAGVQHRVHWESGRAELRFSNDGRDAVYIPALGVELRAGCKVDVRWPAGATGYELQVHRAA
jgi:hypothetical protein